MTLTFVLVLVLVVGLASLAFGLRSRARRWGRLLVAAALEQGRREAELGARGVVISKAKRVRMIQQRLSRHAKRRAWANETRERIERGE